MKAEAAVCVGGGECAFGPREGRGRPLSWVLALLLWEQRQECLSSGPSRPINFSGRLTSPAGRPMAALLLGRWEGSLEQLGGYARAGTHIDRARPDTLPHTWNTPAHASCMAGEGQGGTGPCMAGTWRLRIAGGRLTPHAPLHTALRVACGQMLCSGTCPGRRALCWAPPGLENAWKLG